MFYVSGDQRFDGGQLVHQVAQSLVEHIAFTHHSHGFPSPDPLGRASSHIEWLASLRTLSGELEGSGGGDQAAEAMAVEITLRSNDDRGREILDKFQEWTVSVAMRAEVMDDGTRRFTNFSGRGTDVDAFDRFLDRIDADWRDHVTKLKS